MKKGIAFLLLTSFTGVFAFASHFEAKAIYFQPSEQIFKDIYGSGIMYGGEININIFKGLAIWAGAEYFTKKGKLTFTEEETELRITPIYAGLKYIFQGSKICPYAGLGVGYFLYKESNPIGTVEESKIGFLGQAGIIFRFLKPLVVDLSAGYSSCKVQPAEEKADLGGFTAGIGLGIEF